MASSTNHKVPHYEIFSSLLSLISSQVQILPSIPCSRKSSVDFSLNMRHQVSHSYETIRKITDWYILILCSHSRGDSGHWEPNGSTHYDILSFTESSWTLQTEFLSIFRLLWVGSVTQACLLYCRTWLLSDTPTRSAGLPLTRDQPVAETSTSQHTTFTR